MWYRDGGRLPTQESPDSPSCVHGRPGELVDSVEWVPNGQSTLLGPLQ